MFRLFPLPLLLAAVFSLLCASGWSHEGDHNTTLGLLESRQHYRNDRFGLFIHWGLFSTLGEGESVMNDRKMPIPEYEKLAAGFNPTAFQPADWVTLARSSGMKYITFTARHHDGFALWNSTASDWNVVKRTPFGRDVVKELADECQRQGVKLFLYYSQMDWHHPDYFPRGRTGRSSGRPEEGNWPRYLDHMDAQLRELLTGYGNIDGIWLDGWYDRPDADWRLEQTCRLIHSIQPRTLVGINRRLRPVAGEDFMIYERFLPGEDLALAGFSGTTEHGHLPSETCDTVNGSWGYRKDDTGWKSSRELVHYLVRAASRGANLLLGVGPLPDGRIQPEAARSLREVGMWLAKNGESIYGSEAGPVPPQPWGVTTRRGKKIYVHVLDKATTTVQLQLPAPRIGVPRSLMDDEEVSFRDEGGTVTLTLPPERPGEMDRVVVLQTQ